MDNWHGPRDANGNLVSLWDKVGWHLNVDPAIGGHVRPLQSTADLIVALLNGQAIVVGLQATKSATRCASPA
jgi:hypothetical protein